MKITTRLPSKSTVVGYCTTLSAWRLPKEESALAPENVWSNKDMDPVEPERQTWTAWTWMMYWAVESFSLGTWQIGGSILKKGLTWREALLAVFLGSSCTAFPMVLNGAIGADLHIPFSVAVRASFGYYFAYFCIVSRCVLAMFWLGSVTNNGSTALTVMIRAIWPSYTNIPNTIAPNMGVTTQGMISYLLLWLIQLPLFMIKTEKLRPLFVAKLIVTPAAALATMAWCVHQAGGPGPVFSQEATVSGSQRAWVFLSCASSVSGSLSTLACNIPDFSRFSKSSRAQWVQLPFIPAIHVAGMAIGIVGTSATYVVYGELLWNPLLVYHRWIDTGSSGGRAAAFFCGAAWVLSQIATNITANSISAANDLTVLFPKYLNIRRGCIVASIIGAWVFVPWRIVAAAANLTTFLAGYVIFLAPIAGILCSDYWIVRRKKVDIPALYDPHGRYRYWNGINWRALLALLCALGPTFPGLLYAVGSNTGNSSIHISEGAQHLYSFSFIYGFTSSIFVYVLTSHFFPERAAQVEHTVWTLDDIDAQSTGDVSNEDKESAGKSRKSADQYRVSQYELDEKF